MGVAHDRQAMRLGQVVVEVVFVVEKRFAAVKVAVVLFAAAGRCSGGGGGGAGGINILGRCVGTAFVWGAPRCWSGGGRVGGQRFDE